MEILKSTIFHKILLQEWSCDSEEMEILQSSKDILDGDEQRVILSPESEESESDRFTKFLAEENKSRNWLETNVQNTWWNELDWRQCPVSSTFAAAKLCEFW